MRQCPCRWDLYEATKRVEGAVFGVGWNTEQYLKFENQVSLSNSHYGSWAMSKAG